MTQSKHKGCEAVRSRVRSQVLQRSRKAFGLAFFLCSVAGVALGQQAPESGISNAAKRSETLTSQKGELSPTNRKVPSRIVLTANGYRFDALSAGPPDGELVLFLHGFPEFADAWLDIMRPIAAEGFHTVAVDQRGYSPGARPPNVEDYAVEHLMSDVLAFADELGAKRFHLVAHDWGGILAWQIAAEHPERLRSLTVLSTPHTDAVLNAIENDADQKKRSQYIDFFRLPGGVAESAMLADNAKRLRGVYQGNFRQEAIEDNVRRLTEKGALTSALNWYRALDLKARIGKVTVPTLFIWGAKDHALGEVAAMRTAEYVTGPYRFERLEDKSHWLLEEAPERIVTLLLNHLRPGSISR